MGIKAGRLSSSSWVVAGRISKLLVSILGWNFFGVAAQSRTASLSEPYPACPMRNGRPVGTATCGASYAYGVFHGWSSRLHRSLFCLQSVSRPGSRGSLSPFSFSSFPCSLLRESRLPYLSQAIRLLVHGPGTRRTSTITEPLYHRKISFRNRNKKQNHLSWKKRPNTISSIIFTGHHS